jgi:hypothetical protein
MLRSEPVELFGEVIRAASDVTPRTVIDPRAGYRYLMTLTTQLIRLQTGLLRQVTGRSGNTRSPGVRSVA